MRKAYKRLILTIVIVLISNIITIGIMNKVYSDKINKKDLQIEQIENETTNEILTMKCDFDYKKGFIECD